MCPFARSMRRGTMRIVIPSLTALLLGHRSAGHFFSACWASASPVGWAPHPWSTPSGTRATQRTIDRTGAPSRLQHANERQPLSGRTASPVSYSGSSTRHPHRDPPGDASDEVHGRSTSTRRPAQQPRPSACWHGSAVRDLHSVRVVRTGSGSLERRGRRCQVPRFAASDIRRRAPMSSTSVSRTLTAGLCLPQDSGPLRAGATAV